LKQARRRIEEANALLEDRVRRRTAELEAAIKEMEAFSYAVSHDLRAPLGIISGFSHLLLKDQAPELSSEGRRRLSVVEENANKLTRLVDALLALSSLSRAKLADQAVNLQGLAASVAEDLRPNYPSATIDVEELPAARGDPTLLRQVLFNLIENALKYSSKVEKPRVKVWWSAQRNAWCVQDNGAGFDMAHAEKLFGAFERLHVDAEFPGTGIGLAIVKRIVERHGGTIQADSSPGKGATFYFNLASPAG